MPGTLVARPDSDEAEHLLRRKRRRGPGRGGMLGGMGAVRVVVPDVDEALAAYAAAGYEVTQRWGPPFAILSSTDGPDVWLAGPGTSAAQTTAALPEADRPAASVRQVLEVDDVAAAVDDLVAAGWETAGDELRGPGGSQRLVRRGPVFLEVFAGG